MFSACFLLFWAKWLILRHKNFMLSCCGWLLSCLSWCVQPPVTSPQGFTSRAYYIMHTGGRGGFFSCTFKVVKAV